jgi:hypothetical protein
MVLAEPAAVVPSGPLPSPFAAEVATQPCNLTCLSFTEPLIILTFTIRTLNSSPAHLLRSVHSGSPTRAASADACRPRITRRRLRPNARRSTRSDLALGHLGCRGRNRTGYRTVGKAQGSICGPACPVIPSPKSQGRVLKLAPGAWERHPTARWSSAPPRGKGLSLTHAPLRGHPFKGLKTYFVQYSQSHLISSCPTHLKSRCSPACDLWVVSSTKRTARGRSYCRPPYSPAASPPGRGTKS